MKWDDAPPTRVSCAPRRIALGSKFDAPWSIALGSIFDMVTMWLPNEAEGRYQNPRVEEEVNCALCYVLILSHKTNACYLRSLKPFGAIISIPVCIQLEVLYGNYKHFQRAAPVSNTAAPNPSNSLRSPILVHVHVYAPKYTLRPKPLKCQGRHEAETTKLPKVGQFERP